MKYIIVYDISQVKNRKELSDYLLSERFIRIQKSVFLGDASLKEIKRIIEECNNLIKNKNDSIIIYPICREDLNKSVFIGVTFDIETLERFKYFITYWGDEYENVDNLWYSQYKN